MFIIYDLIFTLFALCYLPMYIFKRKFHQGFGMRLGIFSKGEKSALAGKQPIWLHAVSVGEVLASKQLVEELHRAYSDKHIVISTVTPTGNKVAKKIAKENDFVFYLPLDIRCIVGRVIKLLNPSLVLIAETEVWPNLISCLYKQQVPIITVNARISDGSFKGYRLIKLLTKPILNKITLFCVQTETDANRLFELGVAKEKIKITGNMKFDTSTEFTLSGAEGLSVNGEPRSRTIDNAEPQSAQINDKVALADYAEKRLRLELGDKDMLWVAGSTHHGEEEIVVRVYRELVKEFHDLKLLIAPRHPERAKEIENIVIRYGFVSVFVSRSAGLPVGQLNPHTRTPAHPHTVFILDTIGQLRDFYAISDIVFVGGSLIKKGGQNILEPAALAKPIVCGANMFNFRDITTLFLKNEACIMAHNEEELFEDLTDLLRNPKKRNALGLRAQELMAQNQGATKKNIEWIHSILSTNNISNARV